MGTNPFAGGHIQMGKDDLGNQIRPEPEQSVELSQYDARMSCDTTPTSRVNWVTADGSEGRSASDVGMMVDTTPSNRVDTSPPSGSADVDTNPQSGSADVDPPAPSDQ
jgi:hypothetical protein